MCGIHTRGVICIHLTGVQEVGYGFSEAIPPKFEFMY